MKLTQHISMKKLPSFVDPPSILLVVSPYYETVTNQLVEGATQVLKKANVKINLVEVPGALEIPTAIRLASKHFSGFVALGCVIRGETSHYDTVSNESSRALSYLGLEGICIGNGILTVENYEQAVSRADPSGQNKGGSAAIASLKLLEIRYKFSQKQSD